MNKFIKFIMVMCFTLFLGNFLFSQNANASTVPFRVSTNTEIDSKEFPSVGTFRSRGSCEELVRRGLLSSRSCGNSGNKPKSGEIELRKEEWDCVLKSLGFVGGISANPYTLIGWILSSFRGISSLNACRGI